MKYLKVFENISDAAWQRITTPIWIAFANTNAVSYLGANNNEEEAIISPSGKIVLPLCFCAEDEKCEIILLNEGGNAPILYYSFDEKTWDLWDYSIITLQEHQKVYMYGENPSGFNYSTEQYSFFNVSNAVRVSGNILSLITIECLDEIPCNYCFYMLFLGCLYLISAPQLPATTITSCCYSYMFDGCTNLESAPQLPAITLYPHCYEYMFRSCLNIINPPALPANSLSTCCYEGMFYNCTDLTYINLPALTLFENCYSVMCNGCSALNRVNCYATDISASGCLNNWLAGVQSTGNFYKDANAIYPSGNSGIPSGWTIYDLNP